MDPRYRSELNRDVPPARPGEFAPLHIGPIALPVPVVLAPMAGVTNYPFRAICRGFGAGLYVSEMITARPLVEGSRKTLRLAGFGEEESPRGGHEGSGDEILEAHPDPVVAGHDRAGNGCHTTGHQA